MNAASRIQAILLLLIICATIGGVLYFADQEGIVNVSGPVQAVLGRLPWVGKYILSPPLPPAEIRELERLQEQKAHDDRWTLLKKQEDELRSAEATLNTERTRLAQWEGELERREQAIETREKEFQDREKQYERTVKFYLTMRPAAAAKVLSQQEDLLVIEVFRRMPERNVAAILAEMDPAVAGSIMRKMAR